MNTPNEPPAPRATGRAAGPQRVVVVVGAGPAGLAVSACLRRVGVPHLLLEREATVAASWHRHYRRLHLHTMARHSALPHQPWPAGTPVYPSRQQVVDYLEAYAAQHAEPPQLGVTLRGLRRADAGLELDTTAGRLRAHAVVMATGANRVPNRPAWPGLARFPGLCVHAAQYRDPTPFLGRRTLVVGCGNSGAEIALDLAEHNVPVSMVVRGPVHVVPRDLYGRPSQRTNILLSRLPLALRDAVASVVLRHAVGDLSAYGIVRPALGPNAMIEHLGRVPLLDIGTIAAVRDGRIAVRPGVQAVGSDGVLFADGRRETYDALILATGYRPGLAELVDGVGEIADARGRPHRFGEETGFPGRYFVGFRQPTTGALREIALEAPRVARAIAQRHGGPAALAG